DLVDQVAHAAFQLKLRIEGQVERDGEAVLASDRPAFLAPALDDHLVGSELVGVDAEATTFELLEVAGLEGRPDRPQLLAELRPSLRGGPSPVPLCRLRRRDCARGGRQGRASPARRRAAPAPPTTTAWPARRARRSRSGAATGGCTSSRGRRRSSRRGSSAQASSSARTRPRRLER